MLLLVYCSFFGCKVWQISTISASKSEHKTSSKSADHRRNEFYAPSTPGNLCHTPKHTNYCEERAAQSWHLISVMAYQVQIGKVSGAWHKNRSNYSIRWALRNIKSSHNTIWSVEYDSKQNNGRRKVFVRRRKVSWWLCTTDWSNIRFSPRANLWTLSTR